jgi:hypothetical protein
MLFTYLHYGFSRKNRVKFSRLVLHIQVGLLCQALMIDVVGKPKCFEKNLCQFHCVHQTSHKNYCGAESGYMW